MSTEIVFVAMHAAYMHEKRSSRFSLGTPLHFLAGCGMFSPTRRFMAKREMEKLIDDLKQVSNDAQDLCQTLHSEYLDKKRTVLNRVREGYGTFQSSALTRARAADRTLRQKPYEALGIALVAGLFIGILISRRKPRSNEEQ